MHIYTSDRQDNSCTDAYIHQTDKITTGQMNIYLTDKITAVQMNIYLTDKITAGKMHISDRQDNSCTDAYIR